MKHIGILAHSAEGSALCYLTACHDGARHLGEHMHPEITMAILPMGPTLPHWENLDFDKLLPVFTETAKRLAIAGCDFFICPDNTAHLALEAAPGPLPLPGLHIADVVAEHATQQGYQKIGILGTKWTMTGNVYPDALRQHGQSFAAPSEEDMTYINSVIFDELCNGVLDDASRNAFIRIINDLKGAGCDAVVLGCTEIPLLITADISPLPILDSTRLLARAAVEVAVGNASPPEWRGGKYTREK